MTSRSVTALVVLILAGGCSGPAPEQRARQYAAQKLNVPESALRATERSELATPLHDFYYVTRAEDAPLTVIVPRHGEAFDQLTPGAFDRVARAEHAAERLSQLGPERIALWFAALAGGVCAMPDVDQAHFARAEREDDGLRLSYAFAAEGGARTCAIKLGSDGALRGAANLADARTVATSRRWTSDRGHR